MKKDYSPIAEKDITLSESAYIEQYWTRIWEVNQRTLVPERIENSEEFQIMRPFLSNLPSKSRILDGGCGLGEWTLYFASKGLHVVGLDISKATIDKLKEVFPDHDFKVGDIRSTEFDNDYFDIYFSWGTFEHFESGLGAALREARRILKVGGHLFISVPFQNGRHLRRDNGQLCSWDENYDKDKGYQTRMLFYQWRLTKSELHRELEINGFRTLKVEAIHKQHGLYRTVKHDFNLNPNSIIGKAMQVLLNPFVPKNYVAHMLIAIGQKV